MLTRKMIKLRIRLVILSMLLTFLTLSSRRKGHADAVVSIRDGDLNLLVLTVSTGESINLRRLVRSAQIHDIRFKILGHGRPWKGLGQKISTLKDELQHYKDNHNQIIMFVDALDTLINARADDILQKFRRMNSRIVFSADFNCVPDPSLCPKYPPPETEKKYLNSGLFIGYAPDLYRLVTISAFPDEGNDQLYFTQIFINDTQRKELNFTLDYRCQLFQTVEGGPNIIDILYRGRNAYIYNHDYQTTPLVVHTPGYFKSYINSFANFLPNAWNPIDGCTACLENTLSLLNAETSHFPRVLVAAFIEKPTPEIELFLHWLIKLNYPAERVDLMIYNAVANYTNLLQNFKVEHSEKYSELSVHPILGNSNTNHRDDAIEECSKRRCDFYLSVDSTVHLKNPHSLRLLVEQNRTVVAPLLFGPDGKSNNFLSFAEPDYFVPAFEEANSMRRRGLWNVVAVSSCYIIRGDLLHDPKTRPSCSHPDHVDADMAFSFNLKILEIDLYLSNREYFGYLLTPGKVRTCTIFSCGYRGKFSTS